MYGKYTILHVFISITPLIFTIFSRNSSCSMSICIQHDPCTVGLLHGTEKSVRSREKRIWKCDRKWCGWWRWWWEIFVIAVQNIRLLLENEPLKWDEFKRGWLAGGRWRRRLYLLKDKEECEICERDVRYGKTTLSPLLQIFQPFPFCYICYCLLRERSSCDMLENQRKNREKARTH